MTNLKLDPLKRFIVYNQGFIGLQSKQGQYDDKFKSLPKQLVVLLMEKPLVMPVNLLMLVDWL